MKFLLLTVSRWLLALFFVGAGLAHFLRPEYYLTMIPSWIPFPHIMNYTSGFFEMLFGALVLPAKTRKLAGWGLILLLVAVFPANIYLALHPEIFPGIQPWMAWARLPFQAVFIFWVWRAAIYRPAGSV